MNNTSDGTIKGGSAIPPDDLTRNLVVARSDDPALPHIGLVGDTYTIVLSGKDTGGRFCLIDMHIPPGGGPPPHRHDFEESFVLLDGEIEVTFRGAKSVMKEGETRSHPGQRASPVSKQERPTHAFIVHLFSRRAGRVLREGGCPGCNSNHAASEDGSSRSSGVQSESRRAGSEISDRVAETSLAACGGVSAYVVSWRGPPLDLE